jgi:flagellar assembly factor FliW
VVPNFITEFIRGIEDSGKEKQVQILKSWTIDVDGSSNKSSSGVGLIITSPYGIMTKYAIHFGFEAINNIVEYEALPWQA